MELAERIRLQRRRHGLTQKGLGELIRVSEITIRRWESLKNPQTPDANNLRAIAEALGTTVSYLTGETDQPKQGNNAAPIAKTVNGNAVAGDHNTVTTLGSEKPDKTRWWVGVLQSAYDTVDAGDPQDISDALAAVHQVAAILERAVQDRGVMTA